MSYKIGDIITLEEYTNAFEWCSENNSKIIEIEPEENCRWFQIIEKEPYIPTHDDIEKEREEYRKKHIDSKTAERSRRQANGTWTDEDEQAYLALDAEVTAYIEEHYPYPVNE